MSGSVQVDQEMLAVPTTSEEDSSECDNKHNSSSSSNSDVNVDKDDKDNDSKNDNNSSNNDSSNDDDDLTSSSNDDGDDDDEDVDNNLKTAKKKSGKKEDKPKTVQGQGPEPMQPPTKLIECCADLAKEAKEEAIKSVPTLADAAEQQKIQKEWTDFETDVVDKCKLNDRLPGFVRFGSTSKFRDLGKVWNSLEERVRRPTMKKESEEALLHGLHPKKLTPMMENVLVISHFVAQFHLHHQLEFPHCEGLAGMLVSTMGELVVSIVFFIC